jgi:Zn-dependent M28 family amino/carboxypeptidase
MLGQESPNEIVLVGAHYDSARGTPGANDNGSGLAALFEIARQLRGKPFPRTIRFVAFANEEPPYFQRDGKMGSWVYAKACRARGDNLKAVLSLETLGYYSDAPNSQKYPPLLASFYPNTGNFLGIVSNPQSRPLLIETVKALKKHCEVDVQSAALPEQLQGVGW